MPEQEKQRNLKEYIKKLLAMFKPVSDEERLKTLEKSLSELELRRDILSKEKVIHLKIKQLNEEIDAIKKMRAKNNPVVKGIVSLGNGVVATGKFIGKHINTEKLKTENNKSGFNFDKINKDNNSWSINHDKIK